MSCASHPALHRVVPVPHDAAELADGQVDRLEAAVQGLDTLLLFDEHFDWKHAVLGRRGGLLRPRRRRGLALELLEGQVWPGDAARL
eukprot:3470602-Alexandrium_andersonii.AAC.1